jgi:hypothetical protein
MVMLTGSHRRMVTPWPAMSGAARLTEPRPLPSIATEFVTFAASGGMPVASSAGYATSVVIPPAVPMIPATVPATARNTAVSTAWDTAAQPCCHGSITSIPVSLAMMAPVSHQVRSRALPHGPRRVRGR